jgi:hypothetical protein
MSMDSETTKRIVLARISEWDTAIPGASWFDVRPIQQIAAQEVGVREFVRRNPEAALDHG